MDMSESEKLKSLLTGKVLQQEFDEGCFGYFLIVDGNVRFHDNLTELLQGKSISGYDLDLNNCVVLECNS